MAVTLETIANRVKVSKSAVSLVLRDHELSKQFRPEVRKRIKDVARELGYRPNFFARQLSTRQSKVLMLCFSHMYDPLVSRIAEAFARRAFQKGYRILIDLFRDKEDLTSFQEDTLDSQGISAVAVLGSSAHKLTDEAVHLLAEQKISIVCVARDITGPGIGCVLCDNHAGGALSARHVYEMGKQDVWLVSPNIQAAFLQNRIRGMKQVATELRQPPPRRVICEYAAGEELIRTSFERVAKELTVCKPPQAILTTSDVVAIGAMQALSHHGLSPGKDVAIVGFDGDIFSTCSTPPLTTIRQPTAEMGERGADMLIEMYETDVAAARHLVIQPELVVRDSTALSIMSPSASNPPSDPDVHMAST